MAMARAGQFGTYLKPILIILFGVLLVVVISNLLNFRVGLAEEEQSIEFQQQARSDLQRLVSCLSVGSAATGGRYVLNGSKLAAYERRYRLREPPCAEDFRYGYNVTVEQRFLRGVFTGRGGGGPVQVAFVLDDTGSMGGAISGVKNNIREFLNDLGEGEAAIVTFKDSAELDQGFTGDTATLESTLDSISAGGGGDAHEDVSGGLRVALDDLSWSADMTKAIVVVNNYGAHDCGALSDIASEAAGRNIKVFSVIANAGGSDCGPELKDELPSATGGKTFSLGDPWADIMDEISGQIGGGTERVGDGSTCTPPAINTGGGTVDMVFVADTSVSYDTEWGTLCNRIDETVSEIESGGIDVRVSIYSPGQPGGPENGVGVPMPLPTRSGEYDHRDQSKVPSCVDSADNAAVTSSYGKGVTEWSGEDLVSYDPSQDYGYEAWGVMAKWILENHEWRSGTSRRMLFVFGDQDPTGGPGNAGAWREDTAPDVLDGEVEIVDDIISRADDQDVNVYPVAGQDWEYSATGQYGGGGNDAREIMEYLADRTDGEFMQYSETDQIPALIQGLFQEKLSVFNRTCRNQRFTFGEMEGSTGDSLSRELAFTYPVAVRHSDELRTPGTLRIELRQGELERFAGAINRVARIGRRRGENVSARLDLSTAGRLETGERTVERPVKTTYEVSTPSGDPVDVDDDLVIGVDGHPVLEDRDGSPSSISGTFEGYRGASLQVIAVNREAPDLSLDPVRVTCSGCPDQIVVPDAISASEGDEDYTKGAFYHNFTTLRIGETSTATEPAACLVTGEERCVVLRADTGEISLRPGSHILSLTYWAAEDEVVIDG